MFEIFIRRPILSGVISVVIVFLGLLAITSLPITQFPDIVPPSVTVTARYTGANADVMAKTVATPLERAINGVPGMTYMTTVCTNDGMSLTTIYFKVGTDPDVASVNVQNRVTTVLDELPEEVIRAGVITEKEVNSMLMYLNIMSTDSSHTEKFVYNFADINILRELKRIDGVGFVEIMGSRDYAMRVWLNPNRLAAYNMSPQEVTAAIRSQNIEAAPGKTGISSDKIPQQLQYVLQYSGKFSTPEEYGEIVLKALPDGSVLRLKDVATIEFDSEDYNMISMTDGKPSASIMIKQRPGSNAREVIQNIKPTMEEIKAKLGDKARIGLLATSGTVQTGIYGDKAKALNLPMFVPDELHQERVMAAIYGPLGAKAGYTDGQCREDLVSAAEYLVKTYDCNCLILGCTELPLILDECDDFVCAGKEVCVVDPTSALARKVVRIATETNKARGTR